MKNKYKWIVLGLVSFCVVLTGIKYSMNHSIKAKDRTVELGTSTSLLFEPQYWVEDGVDSNGITVSIQDSSDKEYLDVGTYKVKLTDEDNKKGSCKLIVEDTTAPVWDKTTDTINLTVGQEFVLNDYFNATDLAEINYSMDIDIDTSVEGSDEVVVSAEDASGNKIDYACVVNVVNQNTASSTVEQSTQQQVQVTQQQTQQQSTSVQQQQNTSTPTQSDTTSVQSTPACESIPTGAYTDYASANAAAKAMLDSVSDANGWANSYYKVNVGQTNCGQVYYTYTYGPC